MHLFQDSLMVQPGSHRGWGAAVSCSSSAVELKGDRVKEPLERTFHPEPREDFPPCRGRGHRLLHLITGSPSFAHNSKEIPENQKIFRIHLKAKPGLN